MNKVTTRAEAMRAKLRIGACRDCGELYGFRPRARVLGLVYAGQYCKQCGSELELKRTTWGKRLIALVLT